MPGLSDSTANREAILENALHRFGAQTEAVTLVEYPTPALSLRQIAERHSQRMYSADWSLPEVVYTVAVARLEEWLKNEGPQAAQPVSSLTHFKALIAHW